MMTVRDDLGCVGFELDQGAQECHLAMENTPLIFQKDRSTSSLQSESYIRFLRALFTQVKDEFLDMIPSFQTIDKTKAECAAACTSRFDCRAYEAPLERIGTCKIFDLAGNRTDSACSDDSFFVHHSESLYTRLDRRFCVEASSLLSTLTGMPVEACHQACNALSVCWAIKHNRLGDCHLFSFTDFLMPAKTLNRTSIVATSYKHIIDADRVTSKVVPLHGHCLPEITLQDGSGTEENCTATHARVTQTVRALFYMTESSAQ